MLMGVFICLRIVCDLSEDECLHEGRINPLLFFLINGCIAGNM